MKESFSPSKNKYGAADWRLAKILFPEENLATFCLSVDQHRKQLTISSRDEQGSVVMRQQVSTQWERVRRFFAEVRDLSAALAALWAPGTGALAAARLAGMLADVGAPGRLGISMALWVVVSFALPAGRKFTEGRPLAQTLAAGAAIGVMLFLTSIARGLLGEQTWSLSVFAEGSAAVGLYGAALALPCCWIFVRLNRLRAVAY